MSSGPAISLLPIPPDDLEIQYLRLAGQQEGEVPLGVRIKHLPTNIGAQWVDQPTQLGNLQHAYAAIQTSLQEHERPRIVDEHPTNIGDRLTEAHQRLRDRVSGGENPAAERKQREILEAHQRIHAASDALVEGFRDVARLQAELTRLS